MGKEGQVVPEMTEAIVQNISERYIELFELVTGNKFVPSENTSEVVEENINAAIAKLSIS